MGLPVLPAAAAAVAPVVQVPARAVLDGLGREISAAQSGPAREERAGSLLKEAFDGGNGGSGDAPAVPMGFGGEADDRLSKLDSRVVMILDTLEGEASAVLVERIEKLADLGVHVIFVTSRPDKGENSAESVLVSKLKVRTTNPVVVVSYNGARVSARSSRAENPKPLIEDQPGFAPSVVESFRAINSELKSILKLQGDVTEFGVPDVDGAHLYGVELPAEADLAESASFYNAKLRHLGLQYKMEPARDAGGRQFLFTQSVALKLNTGRIFRGLFSQYPHLREDLKREDVLVLADTGKAASFIKALSDEENLPGKGFVVESVDGGAALESALARFLGVEALKRAKVTRYQLRTYTDWRQREAKWGTSRSGGGGASRAASHGRYYRDLGFYRGIIIYDLMGRLYKLIRQGQFFSASPQAAQEMLYKMWYYPLANGVRLTPEMEALRHAPVWRALQGGTFETAKAWLHNYYFRNFPGQWPEGVSERVVGTMMNLAQDGKNQLKVEYATKVSRYEIAMLPARTHAYRDDQGPILEGHVYRSGKEPYQEEFEDSIEKNLLAHAMLNGYGVQQPDGTWLVNGRPNPRVRIVFHYMTRDLDDIMTPEQIGKDSARVTSLISEMLANETFMAYWAEQQEKDKKSAGAAARARDQRAAKAKAKRAAKAAMIQRKKKPAR